MRSLNGVLAALALAAFGQAGFAATASGSFAVTASVSPTCNVATSDVAFGAYDPASATARDAEGAVRVTCTNTTTYTIALNAGGAGASAFDSRRMLSGTHELPYQLYLDSSRTTVWGDGSGGSSLNPTTGSFTGNGNEQSYTVYGRVPANRYVAPGAYTDTVNVTVTYN